MKKWLIRILVVLFVAFVALLTTAFMIEENDRAVIVKHEKNDALRTVREGWPGTPVDEKGRFVNHEHPFLPSAKDLLKWQLGANPFADEKKTDPWRLEVKDPGEFLRGDRDGILWLGHASFYIRVNGVTMLIDPVFGEPRFMKRFVTVPSPLEQIQKLDYVLLSHDHRDHSDEATLRTIASKFPDAQFLGGLRMDDLFREWGAGKIQTAGWFQEFATDVEVKIAFVPVRHWCRRGLTDTNHRLWGGFVISGGGKKIYFGGDSGFGSHYRETAETFGEIDYFLIGIGAYEPRWFMKANHNNPADAFQAFLDARGKTLVPMHYGTFDLSDEPPGQPLRLLREEAEKAGRAGDLRALAINEALEF